MSDAVKKRGRPAKPKTKIMVGQQVVTAKNISFKTWINCPYFKNGINDALEYNSFYEYPDRYSQIKYEQGRFAGVFLRLKGINKIQTRQGRGGPLAKEIESILIWNNSEWYVPNKVVQNESATD